MGLSRLENFLRSVRGNIIYVDPNSLDSTDSIENTGSALTRPFKTIQRALIEAARFSYLPGLGNDKFTNTTVVLYPGDYLIDNRPGWIPISSTEFKLRNGQTSTNFNEFDLQTNFDVTTEDNALYKFNSVKGGVIIPRGTSIVGMDLRKTKIRPKYVPDPTNSEIDHSALFKVTGGCYIWQLSLFDGNPNGKVYKDYSITDSNTYVPNYSHHKLTAFEYADGANSISINDSFLTYSTDRTDLDIYYQKIGLAYGPASGRNIAPDYPSQVDIQTKIDEFRIVGSRGAQIGITSIKSGDGITPSETITVTLQSELEGLAVDTPIRINGVTSGGYNGQFVVKNVNSATEIEYSTSIIPTNALGGSGGTLNITVDTVTSASPYIFNCSLRSVYGMCGLHADGSLVTGFKSMVVAQFTGISLQKDNNAFVKYNKTTGIFEDTTSVENIYSDSLAQYKPDYENFHIKASNNAFIQCVSIFAIGYANHFLADSGGDMSITNSNSNFGARSLVSKGFSDTKFNKDDVGYISHIIPPKHIEDKEITIEYDSIDIAKSAAYVPGGRLYLYNKNSISSPPLDTIEGYRIGAKIGDSINFIYQNGAVLETYSADIKMQGGSGPYEKSFNIAKIGSTSNNNINSTTGIITLTANHNFSNGETIRIFSDTGELPGNAFSDRIYYAITTAGDPTLAANQIKVASSLNNAINNSSVVKFFSNETSSLRIVSRVSDKNSGDIGHPIQWDGTQWYLSVINVSNIGSLPITSVSPRTFIKRISDNRNIEDTLYKFRYVIPRDSSTKSRPPVEGFTLQESTTIPLTSAEVDKEYSLTTIKTLDNTNQLRNTRFIADATWNSVSLEVTIRTELPNYLTVGSPIEIRNIKSSVNTLGTFNAGYNGSFTVKEILNSKEFKYSLAQDPGTFTSNTSLRTLELPYYNRTEYSNNYYIYRSKTVQEYVQGEQDGIYYLTVLTSSTSPNIAPFTHLEFSQPVKNLYSQIDKDNPNEDPDSADSYALPDPLGQVVVDDNENSITKTTLNEIVSDSRYGNKLQEIISIGSTCDLNTERDHGLNPVTGLVPVYSGEGYGNNAGVETLYNAKLVGFAGSTTGEGATAVIRVNGIGQITNIKLMDGGSAYGIGNTLTVVGVATTTNFDPAVFSVSTIYNHVGESLKVSRSDDSEFNSSYIISGITSSKTISATTLVPTTPGVIGSDKLNNSILELTGKVGIATQAIYNSTTKKISISDSTYFPYIKTGQKVKLLDSSNNYRQFVVTSKNTVGSVLDLIIESSDSNLSDLNESGTIQILPLGYTSEGGENSENNEERLITQYAGITTVTSSDVSLVDTTVQILNVEDLGLKIGDYLEINDEIVRISATVVGNPIQVFRGSLGTQSTIHLSGSLVRKVTPLPIEFRRYSILRASGHTFEYVGFGPGNYSNSLPERQDREKTPQEDLLSQSFRLSGGVNVYTGMNNDGDFYIGNKRVNPATGQEDVFDSPFQIVRGKESEVFNEEPVNFVSTQDINVTRSIKVEGGTNGELVSEFNGPVIFNNKITSNSARGIEGNSLFLQGDEVISRKYTVGISTPIIPGNSGDVVFKSEPLGGGTVGWVYTSGNTWEEFGRISTGGTLGNSTVGVSINSGGVSSSSQINLVAGSGVNLAKAFDSTSGISTVTVTAVPSSLTDLFVSGVSTFIGSANFSGPTQFTGAGTFDNFLIAKNIVAENIQFSNTFSGNAISVDRFTSSESNFEGNLIIGTDSDPVDRFLRVLSGDNTKAGIEAYGGLQGTGYLFVGESATSGGGIFYNGDLATGSFASGEIQDTVGFYRKFSGSNTLVFSYPTTSNDVTFRGTVDAQNFNSSSDERLKTNIEKVVEANEILNQIDGVKFTWKSDNTSSYGVIAQQVEKVLPELVKEDEHKKVNYDGLIAVLIESVKNQQERINVLEEKIKSLESK